MVVEKRHLVGGAAVTEEIIPGGCLTVLLNFSVMFCVKFKCLFLFDAANPLPNLS